MHRSLVAAAALVTAFGVAASATAARPSVQITIRHQVRGCHSWAVGTGLYAASHSLKVKAGTALTFSNNDVMPHQLIQLAGPKVALHNIASSTPGAMGLKGPFAPGMMGRMGAGTQVVLTKPGTYRFWTKVGEDYMDGVKTTGEDNVLRLTVVVS
jgi:plastocyanin